MTGDSNRPRSYRFGLFHAIPQSGELLKQDRRVRLQEQPFRLLIALLEHPGEVVPREVLRQRLWPENTFVEFDQSLGTAITKLRQALGDEAENPRFIETVPRRGYRFLAPVTVVDSERESSRQVSVATASGAAAEASKATNGGNVLEKVVAEPIPASPIGRRFWLIAAMLLLAVGAVAFWFVFRQGHTQEAGEGRTSVHTRRSVAVLGFRNLPARPDQEWLSTAFSEMLNTELAAGGQLRLVSGEDVRRAKRELLIADSETLAKDTLNRLRTNPGADIVVLGSYTSLEADGRQQIRLDVRMQDTGSGETIASAAFTGPEDHLFDLASQAGGRLREALRVGPISSSTMNDVRASLPGNQQAARLYAEGRAHLWEYDYPGARDLLVKAVAADPDYPLSHAALSGAWGQLGYRVKSETEAKRALDLAQHLPHEEHLLVEGGYWQAIEDWPRAVEVFQELSRLYPDDLNYGLRLASSQARVKPEDSLQTLKSLRQLPPPAGDDPRIDMYEASAWVTLDFVKAETAARRAIDRGSAAGSHFLVARTFGILCQQLAYTGSSTTEAINDCERARQSYAAAGNRNGAARTLNDLAIIYAQQGDLTRAKAIWREQLQTFREIGDVQGVAGALNNLGEALLLEGSLTEAKKTLEQAIPSYQTVEDKDGVGRVLNDLGDLLWARGDLEAAKTTYQQGIATAREIDDKSVIAFALTGIGDVLMAEGDLTAATKSYQDSLAMRTQLDEKQPAAETQVALARIFIEQGRAVDAEADLRKSRQQFHDEQEVDDELTATVVLSQSLLAQNKIAEARAELDSAKPLASKAQRRLPRFGFEIMLGQVLSASGDSKAARTSLERALKEATALGFAGSQFEARLALAELQKKWGQATDAQVQLAVLERAARTRGFVLIASKAAAARGGV